MDTKESESNTESDSVKSLYLQIHYLMVNEDPPLRLDIDYNTSAQIEEFERLIPPNVFESVRNQVQLVVCSEKPRDHLRHDFQPFELHANDNVDGVGKVLLVYLPMLRILENNYRIKKLWEELTRLEVV